MFSGSGNTTGLVRILSDVKVSGKSMKAAINRSAYEIAYVIAFMCYSNKISTVLHMFSGSDNTTKFRAVPDVKFAGYRT